MDTTSMHNNVYNESVDSPWSIGSHNTITDNEAVVLAENRFNEVKFYTQQA